MKIKSVTTKEDFFQIGSEHFCDRKQFFLVKIESVNDYVEIEYSNGDVKRIFMDIKEIHYIKDDES